MMLMGAIKVLLLLSWLKKPLVAWDFDHLVGGNLLQREDHRRGSNSQLARDKWVRIHLASRNIPSYGNLLFAHWNFAVKHATTYYALWIFLFAPGGGGSVGTEVVSKPTENERKIINLGFGWLSFIALWAAFWTALP